MSRHEGVVDIQAEGVAGAGAVEHLALGAATASMEPSPSKCAAPTLVMIRTLGAPISWRRSISACKTRGSCPSPGTVIGVPGAARRVRGRPM